MIALVHSELLKLRTIRRWWLALAAVVATTLLSLAWNIWQSSMFLQPFESYLRQAYTQPRDTLSAEQVTIMLDVYNRQSDLGRIAANLYTSGQFLALLAAALLGLLIVTNEHHHRTAAATFLMTPRRSRVVAAKLVATVIVAGSLGVASTVISVLGGAIFLASRRVDIGLTSGPVLGSVLLHIAALVIWAVFGFGVGALVRSQVGATALVVGLYLLSTGFSLVFQAIHEFVLERDWVLQAQVLAPAVASQVLTTPGEIFPQAPARWVGAAVLIGYGVLGGALGARTLIRRDVPV